MRLAAVAAAAAAWLIFLAAPGLALAEDGPFADWAAIFVAGDWRGHNGGPSEAFDNARRDLAKAFVDAGFKSQNIRQFSVRPEADATTAPFPSDLDVIRAALNRLTLEARGGCLVYFTSHGSPEGAVVGQALMPPRYARQMLDEACGDRPTVAVISACFSGVFVPELAGPNRMVVTAARRDRSSFGCGESDRYPYFDACVLESLPQSPDFTALAREAQGCVARREKEEGLSPASEPQVAIGGELRPVLPLLALRRAGGPQQASAVP